MFMAIRFLDGSGQEWEVFEVVRVADGREAVRSELANGWLTFQSSGGVGARLGKGQYPAGWEQLPPAELEALMRNGVHANPYGEDAHGGQYGRRSSDSPER
jgi:hypothetical protein